MPNIMSSEMPPLDSGSGQGPAKKNNGSTGCRRESYYIENCKPGKKLFARYWYPKAEASIKGLVFICHGFAEHLGYYDEFAVFLANLNMVAFGHDHSGHGLSDGKRGTIESIDEFVEEVFIHASKMKLQYPKVPFFMFGHSMGGLIAIRSVLRNRSFFSGIVLEGPLIVPSTKPSFVMNQIGKLAKYFIPDYVYLGMDLEDVTRDQAAVKTMEKDPLRWHGGIKVSMAVAFNEGMHGLAQEMPKITIPFLILHAEEDKLCDVEGSRLLYKKSKSKDKQLITFPNAGHNLFLEQSDIRLQAMTESATWFSRRCRRA